MPYVPNKSPEYERSASPDDEANVRPSGPPTKKVKLTASDVQRIRLENMLQNPEKEIKIPTGPQERSLRAPREMMKNVQGSSSGAGSGEFHVYKQSRRREYERVKMMEDTARNLAEQAAFQERQAARDAVADAKTEKNRLKRMKRKQGRKGGPGPGGAAGRSGAGADEAKSKLAGGAKVVFKRPGEYDSDDDEEEEDDEKDEDERATTGTGAGAGSSVTQLAELDVAATTAGAQPALKVIDEVKILVHDDE